MKLTYFVSPYDLLDLKTRSPIPLTVDGMLMDLHGLMKLMRFLLFFVKQWLLRKGLVILFLSVLKALLHIGCRQRR